MKNTQSKKNSTKRRNFVTNHYLENSDTQSENESVLQYPKYNSDSAHRSHSNRESQIIPYHSSNYENHFFSHSQYPPTSKNYKNIQDHYEIHRHRTRPRIIHHITPYDLSSSEDESSSQSQAYLSYPSYPRATRYQASTPKRNYEYILVLNEDNQRQHRNKKKSRTFERQSKQSLCFKITLVSLLIFFLSLLVYGIGYRVSQLNQAHEELIKIQLKQVSLTIPPLTQTTLSPIPFKKFIKRRKTVASRTTSTTTSTQETTRPKTRRKILTQETTTPKTTRKIPATRRSAIKISTTSKITTSTTSTSTTAPQTTSTTSSTTTTSSKTTPTTSTTTSTQETTKPKTRRKILTQGTTTPKSTRKIPTIRRPVIKISTTSKSTTSSKLTAKSTFSIATVTTSKQASKINTKKPSTKILLTTKKQSNERLKFTKKENLKTSYSVLKTSQAPKTTSFITFSNTTTRVSNENVAYTSN